MTQRMLTSELGMDRPKRRRYSNSRYLVASVLLLLIVLCGSISCILIEDSPAPGCQKYLGLAPMGGCFGKSAIKDLKVEPSLDCVTIEVNNCNGGVLDVSNRCSQPLILGGIQIRPSDFAILDIKIQQKDSYNTLTRVTSNFSKYIPEKDELIQVTGKLGNQDIKLRYVKTKRLCD